MRDDIASAALKGLNEQQSEVVQTHTGQVLCVAGAGSGKTTALVRRVVHLIATGVDARSILLMTFTRAAAREMLARARALCPEAEDVSGGTFHSIGSSVVREYAGQLGLSHGFTVIDPEDATDIIKLVSGEWPGDGAATPRASVIQKCISYAYNTQCSLFDAVEQRAPNWVHRRNYVENIASRYIRYKQARSVLDYDDILLYWAALLADQTAASRIRARWPYVMIDEHQDSNALQLKIVYGLAGDDGNVLVVGDPAQAIYGFRGSAPETLFDFAKRFKRAKIINLETNYRSAPAIVKVANAIDQAMSPRFDRILRAGIDDDVCEPLIFKTADAAADGDAIAGAVIDDVAARGDYSRHAVLARSMSLLRPIEAEFLRRNIPYVVRGGLRITEAAHIKDLICLGRIAENPRDEPAWIRLLIKLPRIGQKKAGDILQEIAKGSDLTDAVTILAREGNARDVIVDHLVAALRAASNLQLSLQDRLARTVAEIGPSLKYYYADDWEERARDLVAVIDIAGQFESMRHFLEAMTLDFAIDKKARAGPSTRDEDGAVTLSTIHSAKGLEWETVHIPGFIDTNYPSVMARTPGERQEELRCLYVAATRARSSLNFYRPLTRTNGMLSRDSEFWPIVEPHFKVCVHKATSSAAAPMTSATPIQIDMSAALSAILSAPASSATYGSTRQSASQPRAAAPEMPVVELADAMAHSVTSVAISEWRAIHAWGIESFGSAWAGSTLVRTLADCAALGWPREPSARLTARALDIIKAWNASVPAGDRRTGTK